MPRDTRDGRFDVLTKGRVNANYNLWTRNPVEITAQELAENTLPGARGYKGPSY